MSEYAEKVRSIAAPRRWGQAVRKPVINEDNGRVAGFHREHWDDHQDAVAAPPTVKVRISQNQED